MSSVMRFKSGAPWHLTCEVEPVGPDYLCRIHGGDAHVGAIALSHWEPTGVVTDCLVVPPHKEREIAVRAARSLCEVSRSSVCCMAGIHYDSLTREEVADILREAFDLIERAATELAARSGMMGSAP